MADSWCAAGGVEDALRECFVIRRSGDASQKTSVYIGLACLFANELRYADAAGLACMAAKTAEEEMNASGGMNAHSAAVCSGDCASLCSKWGDAMYVQGHYGGAYACYNMALSIDPDNAEASCGIGDLYLIRASVVDQDPDNAEASCGIGNPENREDPNLTARRYYEKAIKVDKNLARAQVGIGTSRCKFVNELTNDRPTSEGNDITHKDRRFHYKKAIEAFDEAIKIDPENFKALMGIGEALRWLAGDASHDYPEKATEYLKRATIAYNRAMSLSDLGAKIEPCYWKGVCELYLGENERLVRESMKSVLDDARPRGWAEHEFCGKICDILGEYERACEHYVESIKGNPLYTGGFHKTINMDRVCVKRTTPSRFGTDSVVPYKIDGSRTRSGGGYLRGIDARAVYVLDANVIICCAATPGKNPRSNLEPDVISGLIKGIKDKNCQLPGKAFDEANSKMEEWRDHEGRTKLFTWSNDTTSLPKHKEKPYVRSQYMKKAREALMTAWLYSDSDVKKKWRNCKFKYAKLPYTGGPPEDKGDVEILATAAYIADKDGAAGVNTVILVTMDADFLDFKHYIREVLSIDVKRPKDAAKMLASAVREREQEEELGKRPTGAG